MGRRNLAVPTCVYRKLDSAILVVEATENWVCRDGTEALNRAMERRAQAAAVRQRHGAGTIYPSFLEQKDAKSLSARRFVCASVNVLCSRQPYDVGLVGCIRLKHYWTDPKHSPDGKPSRITSTVATSSSVSAAVSRNLQRVGNAAATATIFLANNSILHTDIVL